MPGEDCARPRISPTVPDSAASAFESPAKAGRSGLLISEQGTNGGYRLARDPHEISALEVIRSIDGPIILTQCFTEHDEPTECDQSELCPVREPLRKVHEGILRLLSGITISDLAQDDMPIPVHPQHGFEHPTSD